MIPWNANILVLFQFVSKFGSAESVLISYHIKGHDIGEGDVTGIEGFDEVFVHFLWAASSREPKDEWTLGCRGEIANALCLVVSR